MRRICAALLLAAAACSASNTVTQSYATLAEARQAGAVAQGALPDGLPPGTREIRTAHLPGTSQRWGLFNFPPSEAAALKAILTEGEVPLAGAYVNVPGRIEWWPVALRGDIDAERVGTTGLRAYHTTDGALIVAVNWNQGRAFYWPAR